MKVLNFRQEENISNFQVEISYTLNGYFSLASIPWVHFPKHPRASSRLVCSLHIFCQFSYRRWPVPNAIEMLRDDHAKWSSYLTNLMRELSAGIRDVLFGAAEEQIDQKEQLTELARNTTSLGWGGGDSLWKLRRCHIFERLKKPNFSETKEAVQCV